MLAGGVSVGDGSILEQVDNEGDGCFEVIAVRLGLDGQLRGRVYLVWRA